MRVAVVGGGISGIVAAHVLSRVHDVVLFERNNYVGGHTNTRTVIDPEMSLCKWIRGSLCVMRGTTLIFIGFSIN